MTHQQDTDVHYSGYQSPPSDELHTAASYYILYAQAGPLLNRNDASQHSSSSSEDATNEQSRPADESAGAVSAAIDDGIEGGGASAHHSFWVEDDEWTEDQVSEAKATLANSMSLCDVESSSARGSFLIRQFEEDAGKNWDSFYARNTTKFFKDRHYLHKTFPEEFGPLYAEEIKSHAVVEAVERVHEDSYTVVEIGCGVGNTVLPLLERGSAVEIEGKPKKLVVWGLDFSPIAIDLLKKDLRFVRAFKEERARAAVWDITKRPPDDCFNGQSVASISILLFCLSAISPDKMADAAKNVASILKPGGTLVFRDYGRFDEAQMKLGTSRCKRLGENFYVKHDGTRCYYFNLDDLRRLFGPDEGAGLEILELKFLRRTYLNRSQDVARRRVWVQGRFRKPL